MARRSDPRPKRRRGVLRHYHRPIWKDRLFWLIAVASVVATALFTAVVLVITAFPDTPLGWLRPVLLGLVVLLLSFRLLGAGVTTSRHFQRGLGEGSSPRPNDLEAKGRAAGAVVGRAVKVARSPKTSPTPIAPSTPMGAQVSVEPVTTGPPRPSEPDPAPATAATGTRPTEPDVDAPAPARVTAPEPIDRPAATAPSQEAEPEADPTSETTAPSPAAAPKVTADAAARSLGSMVGRRLAERRKKT